MLYLCVLLMLEKGAALLNSVVVSCYLPEARSLSYMNVENLQSFHSFASLFHSNFFIADKLYFGYQIYCILDRKRY